MAGEQQLEDPLPNYLSSLMCSYIQDFDKTAQFVIYKVQPWEPSTEGFSLLVVVYTILDEFENILC